MTPKGTLEQNKANWFEIHAAVKAPVHITQPDLQPTFCLSMCNPCGVNKITTNSKTGAVPEASN